MDAKLDGRILTHGSASSSGVKPSGTVPLYEEPSIPKSSVRYQPIELLLPTETNSRSSSSFPFAISLADLDSFSFPSSAFPGAGSLTSRSHWPPLMRWTMSAYTA